MKRKSIKINPKNKGLFTKKAKEHGMGVQEFASYVLAHPDKFDASTVHEAAFAHNIANKKAQAGTYQSESATPFINNLPTAGNPIDFTNMDTPLPNEWNYQTTKTTDNTDKYIKGFNFLATGVTAAANTLQNNKLRRKEQRDVIQSLQPQYYSNMEGEGLNANPMYTQYGGGFKAGFNFDSGSVEGGSGGIVNDASLYEGISHPAFYGQTSINSMKYGGKYMVKRPYGGGPLTSEGAKEILRDGTVHGKKLTAKQKRYFGWVAGGKKQTGGNQQDQQQQIMQIIQLYAQMSGQDPQALMQQLQQMPPDQQSQAIQQMAQAVQQGQQQDQGQHQQFQTGGQSQQLIVPQNQVLDTAALKTKYKDNPYLNQQGRYNWGSKLDTSFQNGPGGNVREAVYNAANQNKINPALLYSSAMEEGMSGRVDKKSAQTASEAYVNWAAKNKDISNKYPIDSFYNYGLDQFANQVPILQKKGYLPKDFNNNFTTFDATNEKNQKVKAAAFNSDANALVAKSAMMRQSQDQLDEYVKKTGVKLSPKQKDFFLLANYNAGEGNMQKMLKSYQDKGYLKNDDFLNPSFKPASYSGVYNNVQARLQSAKQLQDEGYFNTDNKQQVPTVNSSLPKGAKLETVYDEKKRPIQGYVDPETGEFITVSGITSPGKLKYGGKRKKKSMYYQMGGVHQMPDGSMMPDNEMAELPGGDVEAEEGEIVESQDGDINKIPDNAGTHEEGGVKLSNVSRVLEDTSDKRKDKASKLLKITPEEMQGLFGFKPKSSVSHSKAFELATKHYNDKRNKVRDANKVINSKPEIDKLGSTTAKLNFKNMENIPSEQDVYDALFMHQEAVKDIHDIQDNGKMGKYGWQPKYKVGGKWIAGAIKHPGRCANPGDENCPEGSPQYRLAMRFKHGDLHKQTGGIPNLSTNVIPTPQFKFSPLMTPTAVDSAMYRIRYNKMLARDPEAMKIYQERNLKGVPIPNRRLDLEVYNDDRSRINAYEDALHPIFMPPSPMRQAGGRNFSSKEAYQKWLAYGHMHGDFENTPGNQKIEIRGKAHQVKHAQTGTDQGYSRPPRGLNSQNYYFDEGAQRWFKNGTGPAVSDQQQSDSGLAPYSGGRTPGGSVTPMGNPNAFNFSGGLDAYKEAWSPVLNLDQYKTPAAAQAATYDYLVKNQPQAAASIWEKQGLTQKGRDMMNPKSATYDPSFARVAGKVFDESGKLQSGTKLSPEQLQALSPAYSDNMLGVRSVTPEILNTPDSTETITQPYNRSPLDASVNINPKFIKQPANKFFEPTYWDELAPELESLVSSLNRDPELYNPVEFHQLNYKLLDPTAAMNANQADYNAAKSQITGDHANLANLQAQKYAANAQVQSQYDTQNVAIKNQEIGYNTNVRDRQSVANAQTRSNYYQKVQESKQAQKEQRQQAIEDIAKVIQMKRRQNASGNLIMKLSPAFNQRGEYNGYQYAPTLPNDSGLPPGYSTDTKTTTTGKKYVIIKDAQGKEIGREEVKTVKKG